MDIPAPLTAAFPPSAALLLDRTRRVIDDAMLMDIAMADYGIGAEDALAVLRPIRNTGIVPRVIPNQLPEVLQLIRWSNPEKPNPPPFRLGPTGIRGHQTRLLACAVLLRGSEELDIDGFENSEESTLAQCLASAGVLGEEMSEAVGCFLSWRLSRTVPDQPIFFALSFLIIATRLRSKLFSEVILGRIAEWVIGVEAHECKSFAWNPSDPRPIEHSLYAGFWQPLAVELKAAAAMIQSDEVRTNLQLCALLIDAG